MVPMMIMKVRMTKATIPRSQLKPLQVRGFFGAGAAAAGAGVAATGAASPAGAPLGAAVPVAVVGQQERGVRW